MKLNLSGVFLLSFTFFFNTILSAQTIRPIRDSVGFCWNATEMDSIISFLEKDAENFPEFPSKNLVAAVSPHDDYLYAGRIYFPVYHLIKAKEIVIFGVTHGTVRRAMSDPKNVLILDNYNLWKGPYGNVEISPLREEIKQKLNHNYFIVSNKAQRIEHSIEALIPFLQYYNRDIKITPIMVTAMPFNLMEEISDSLTKIIVDYVKSRHLQLGKDIFFLISNDADHYGADFNNTPFGTDLKAHTAATNNDKRILKKYINRTINKTDLSALTNEIWKTGKNKPLTLWCGRYPITFGLLTVDKIVKNITGETIYGKLFMYSDTFTEGVLPIKHTHLGTTAPFSLKHWVGFFSAGFYIN
ncbi:hypothetical protein BMS3Abin04_01909 [bacterium BMS3Abin04]|nr:hypothetical protein BMS3Abin04_01909 [bacterium BMS3Abin04]